MSPGRDYIPAMPVLAKSILLLVASNVFMTFAWYGHLKFKRSAIGLAILVSWLIAFVEYCFQVPANRIGHNAGFSASHLKITQEAITLVVFVLFAKLYLNEPIKWNYYVGFALVLLAVFFVFHDWGRRNSNDETRSPNQIRMTKSE